MLVLADLDQDGWGDLFSGAPFRDAYDAVDAGLATIQFGVPALTQTDSIFEDDFESGDAGAWSTVVR